MSYLPTFISAKLFLLLAMGTLFTAQKNALSNEQFIAPIMKISYSSSAGRGGTSINLDITAASMVYTQGHNGAEKTIKEKTPRALWQKLTKSINLQDLDKVKSNPGHAMYDGTDITIVVLKGREEHSIVNGNEDILNYKKIKLFTDILEGQLTRLGKRMSW